MITFEQLKKLAESCVSQGGEPEISLIFSEKKSEYMIIAVEGRCSFQRCGAHDGSGEFFMKRLTNCTKQKRLTGYY